MKLHLVTQGEPEWFAVRMGIPTASEMHRIITPAKGNFAEGRWSYAFELAAERLLLESKQTIDGLEWIERGKVLEFDAAEHFEFVKKPLKTVKVGFVTTDDGRWGCSPDRLVYQGEAPNLSDIEARKAVAGLEIKAPSPAIHLQYLTERGPGFKYKCQVQGSLLVTGFDQWWFESYHPNLPQVLVSYERDEPFIEKMRDALEAFGGEVDDIVEKVKDAGYVPPPGRAVTPTDQLASMIDGTDGLNYDWAG